MFPCHEAKQRRYQGCVPASAQGSRRGQATNGNCGFEIGSCEELELAIMWPKSSTLPGYNTPRCGKMRNCFRYVFVCRFHLHIKQQSPVPSLFKSRHKNSFGDQVSKYEKVQHGYEYKPEMGTRVVKKIYFRILKKAKGSFLHLRKPFHKVFFFKKKRPEHLQLFCHTVVLYSQVGWS